MTAAHESLAELAHTSKAWPFEEARKILKRLEKADPAREVVFETGYGPSGLPHIGTFGEVARTSMVRHAFEVLKPGVKTRLVCFSDDMDGLRKVPHQCAEPGAFGCGAGEAADGGARSVRHASRASARTTMRGCAPSSTASASNTSSCRRPSAIARASSTRRC